MTRPMSLGARVGAVVMCGGLLVAACGKDDTSSKSSGGGSKKVSGEVVVSGSSTVEPISIKVAEQFQIANPDASVSVEGPGTGDGFKKFCAGETDISDASRPIKDEEADACKTGGVEYTELKIGLDALTVMTNEANDAVECLTFADLYGLVGPESEDVKMWSDAAKHGATTKLPDAELKIFAPGQESGTYDSFFELAIKEIAEEQLGDKAADAALRPDYGGLADDNQIVEGVASEKASFGWVGFAFAEQAQGVRELEIDGGKGCVGPSKETVLDGTYPLSRSLYIYVNNAKVKDNAALKAFVDFYVSEDGLKSVGDAGYVDIAPADAEAARSSWEKVASS